jgi:Outer membrane lipoprotein-sorting protein
MEKSALRAPMLVRRALAAFGALTAACLALGQGYTPVPDLGQVGLPDQAAGQALLEKFRQSINAEPVYLEFELHALPRRGDEVVFKGRLWGGRNDRGPITRIALTGVDGRERSFLVQGGGQGGIWRSEGGTEAVPEPSDFLQPLVPGVETTAFDLQMPFLYWPEPKLVGVNRIRGRPAYCFVFQPPADVAARYSGLSGVRAYLDAEYPAPVQFEILGTDGKVEKTWSLLDLKRIGGKWIVKEVDVRNEATRDKTRFLVTGAALGVKLAASLFEPARLAEAPPAIVEAIVPIAP